MQELKPCPFCGEKVVISQETCLNEIAFYVRHEKNTSCYMCNCMPYAYSTAEKAAEIWNMRVEPKKVSSGSAPSAQRWIPVTEDLPDEGVEVLVYRKVLSIIQRKEVFRCIDADRIVIKDGEKRFLFNNNTVIAWMPAPPPYKEGDNNETD